ncbi:MAG: hypothetical protein PHX21_13540 [bacterium]|nr:hypothetical protein [bacterium]
MNYKLLDLSKGTKALDPKRPCKGLIIQLDKEGKNNLTIEFESGKERQDAPFIKEITDVRISIKKSDLVDTVIHSSIKV